MTDAHDQEKERSGAKPLSAGLPQSPTVGCDAPLAARQARESGKPTSVRDLATRGVSPGETAHIEPDVGEATVESRRDVMDGPVSGVAPGVPPP